MLMAQVYIDNQPMGSFRTQGRNAANPNAVGEDYEVACEDSTEPGKFIAQQSVDRFSSKKKMAGLWFNNEAIDLYHPDVSPYCV